ncbi:MAG: Asp-tRNA(Asn)/Glu-tRNA(Gln) amidotransferase subunit GatC [Elusimicrobiota bacterium]
MDAKQVDKVAILARLEFTPEEKQKFPEQLSNILNYIDQLTKLDTGEIQPMGQPLGELMDKLRLAEDNHLEYENREELLKNAPDPSPPDDPEYFRVKKVIE